MGGVVVSQVFFRYAAFSSLSLVIQSGSFLAEFFTFFSKFLFDKVSSYFITVIPTFPALPVTILVSGVEVEAILVDFVFILAAGVGIVAFIVDSHTGGSGSLFLLWEDFVLFPGVSGVGVSGKIVDFPPLGLVLGSWCLSN